MADTLLTLGKGVYLSKPRPNTELLQTERSSIQPSVILIFSWMGAQLPHLRKYSDVYGEIYPGATQIIVRSEASLFFSSESSKRAYLEPAVLALEHLGYLPRPKDSRTIHDKNEEESLLPTVTYPRVLVHAFSNGGSSQLAMLGNILKSRPLPSGQKYPKTALILDSCPGDGGVDGTLRAFSQVVRNPILRAIVRFVIRLLYFYATVIRRVTSSKKENVIDRLKAQLNDEHLLPWFNRDTPRLYLYSLKDDMIPYHEVEKHAAQAKDLGFSVKLEQFEDSAHVAHAKAYPVRYWAAVRRLWEDACGNT